MRLRGSIADFPLETIIQLVAGTGKTGQLEVRVAAQSGSLGFAGGKLVAATAGDDVGETALGAVFTLTDADFEFVPWSEPPAANLSGALDELLDRAVIERDQILLYRELIPRDEMRFALSERANVQGEITLTSEQWRTLRAVDGQRDLLAIAQRLAGGRLATLAVLSGLVRAGLVDTVEPPTPAPTPEPDRPFVPAADAATAEPAASAPAAAAPRWEAPVAQWEPAAEAPSWEAAPTAPTWEATTPAQEWGSTAPPVTETPPSADDRLSALPGILGPAEPAPPPTWGPLPPLEAPPGPEVDPRLAGFAAPAAETEIDPRLAAFAVPAPSEAPPVVEPAPPPTEEPKRKTGIFGGLFGARAEALAAPSPRTPVVEAASRAGKLAMFANELLAEYASGRYGKEGLDDHMPDLLMRVDEQADPIDRPLPVTDDRIDVGALERAGFPERQALPYLATVVSQIYRDAERAFGKDKAKRGYRAAQQSVFGADAHALATPELAGRLPKI